MLIETHSVTKTFGSQTACDAVSLAIPQGSLYGLLGPNGAGKTTLIRMITTITRPDSGEIFFNGQPLNDSHAAGMGYMPEERGLYKKMSVIDQMLFFAEIKGLTGAQARDRARYWLNRMEIASWANKKLEELSKGMAQKVQFLCTILHNPEFIILDEPFSGFDPVNADLVKDLIIELNKNGSTILFSTHRMDNVEELCSHICIVNNGKKVLDGEAGGIRRRMFKQIYEAGYLEEVNFNDDEIHPAKMERTSDGRFMYHFDLSTEPKPEKLLAMCVSKGGLIHFSESLPTMHQIFVNTIKGGTENA